MKEQQSDCSFDESIIQNEEWSSSGQTECVFRLFNILMISSVWWSSLGTYKWYTPSDTRRDTKHFNLQTLGVRELGNARVAGRSVAWLKNIEVCDAVCLPFGKALRNAESKVWLVDVLIAAAVIHFPERSWRSLLLTPLQKALLSSGQALSAF